MTDTRQDEIRAKLDASPRLPPSPDDVRWLLDELSRLTRVEQGLREALEKSLAALPDSVTGGPGGTGYRYAWDECTGDEQEWVKRVRAQCQDALSRLTTPPTAQPDPEER